MSVSEMLGGEEPAPAQTPPQFDDGDDFRDYDPGRGTFATGLFEGTFDSMEGPGMAPPPAEEDDLVDQVMALKPVYKPVTLDGVQKRDAKKRKDENAVRRLQVARGINSKHLQCILCEIDGDTALGNASGTQIAAAFELERNCNRSWDKGILYRAIASNLNRALDQAGQSTSDCATKWHNRRVSVAECRLHFEHGHDRNILRMMWTEIEHLDIELDQMRHGALWRETEGDETHTPAPDPVNQAIYDKKLARKESLIKTLLMIEKEMRMGSSGGGSGNTGGPGRKPSQQSSGGGGGGGVGNRSRNQGRQFTGTGRTGTIRFK